MTTKQCETLDLNLDQEKKKKKNINRKIGKIQIKPRAVDISMSMLVFTIVS